MQNNIFLTESKLFEAKVAEIKLRVRVLGKGEPLLLLHGYPQTHFMWHKLAPLLAPFYTLIMPDLRGYGASSKPETDAFHTPYSKREMAKDLILLMDGLGYKDFFICGHDRGGRVAHRLVYDFEPRVKKFMTLDIAPTREMYQETGDKFARAYWHWFFLIQKAPFPEKMIEADAKAYWLKKCGSGSAGLSPFADFALEDYLKHFTKETIHASCEDYRAAAEIDIEHDNEETRKINVPLHALWGEHGAVHACFDVLKLWRKRVKTVTGKTLPTGHYMAEERPELVAEEILKFFKS